MENYISIKNRNDKKYYNDFSNSNTYGSQNIDSEKKNERIIINFRLKNFTPGCKYFIKLNFIGESKEIFVSETVLSDNSSTLAFRNKFSCYFDFGKEQKMNIIIMKAYPQNNSEYYQFETSVAEIMGKDNLNLTKAISFNGKNSDEILSIKASRAPDDLFAVFHFEIICKPRINFAEEKNKIYFIIFGENDYKIYESQTYTDDGLFNLVQIPTWVFKSKIKISFFNYKNQYINCFETNLQNLASQKIIELPINKNTKLYIKNRSSIRHEILFFDYIKSGVKIGLCLGIDFTASNGHPLDVISFHSQVSNEKNPYEKAIDSCVRKMSYYDDDDLYPVYGFGAILKENAPTNDPVSMCFSINFNEENPNIKSVDNILYEYKKCIEKITQSGPTFFAPIINKIIDNIKKQNDILEYQVLMFLTDGVIDDMDDTIDALVEGSYYPLSVIIIGIGDGEAENGFKKMEQLDGDDIPLVNRKGIKRMRDLVQFVQFNKFENSDKLAEEVFEEIPRQVIEYYTLNFIYPETLSTQNYQFNVNKNFNNVKNNFKNDDTVNNINQNNVYNNDNNKKIYVNNTGDTPGNNNIGNNLNNRNNFMNNAKRDNNINYNNNYNDECEKNNNYTNYNNLNRNINNNSGNNYQNNRNFSGANYNYLSDSNNVINNCNNNNNNVMNMNNNNFINNPNNQPMNNFNNNNIMNNQMNSNNNYLFMNDNNNYNNNNNGRFSARGQINRNNQNNVNNMGNNAYPPYPMTYRNNPQNRNNNYFK